VKWDETTLHFVFRPGAVVGNACHASPAAHIAMESRDEISSYFAFRPVAVIRERSLFVRKRA
jgi:hypothetical protein